MSDVRIVILTDRYPLGGASQMAMTLVRGLERKHEVTFITGGKADCLFEEEHHRRIVVGLPRFAMFWHHYWNRSVLSKLRRHLARIRPDVVHLHSVANRTFSAEAVVLSRDYPTVWTLHDLWSQCVWYFPRPPQCRGMLRHCLVCPRMPALSIVNKVLKERAFRRADLHLIACSHWQNSLLAASALADVPIEVIPNGIDTEAFSRHHDDETRRSLGIPTDGRVVLWAGQLKNRLKGYPDLMLVAKRVLVDNPDVWFLFVGPHEGMRPEHPHFVLSGGVPYAEMPRYFAAADVFAYPTHADSFGRVVAEAMAAGLPVVAYRVMAIPELISDGVTGILVDENDDRRFETELRRLLADAGLRRRMGQAGRRRIRAHFSLDVHVARTEALYRQAITERKRKRGKPLSLGAPESLRDERRTREPLVSIVMPAYNTGRFIAQAIRSVLRQTYTNWELIVVDDGSTDNTAEVVATFPDPRIRCVSRENTGLSAARNDGIRRARGEYIAFLDSDDLWFPEKLAAQVKILEEDPEAGLTYSSFWFVDEDGVRIGAPRFSLARLADGWCLEKLLMRCAVLGGGTTVMLRHNVLDRVGLFDTDLGASEDWDMWRRVAVHCKFRYLPRALAAYRTRRGSLTERHDLMERCERMVMERAFADPEVKRRVPADRRRRLRWRADAVHFYNIGSRQLRAGDVAQAVRSFMRSIGATLHNFRQVVMLVFSLVLLLPFVNRDRLLAAIGR